MTTSEAPLSPEQGRTPPAGLTRARARQIIGRLTLWVVFGVIFGLLPIWIDALRGVMSPQRFSWMSILAKGELFIASSALAAAAVGELVFAPFGHEWQIMRAMMVGSSLLCCIGNAVAYTQVAMAGPGTVANVSLTLFVLTLAASAACVGLAAGR
ncbi:MULTISPECIES: hypothetical protein [unclassified Nonomuraea]|uniref:hypothetical protein n=1 Tax=unclassified Nonomuraea TaxID=2593643 RepID=UPI00332BBA88